ncbi:MAG: TonB-dependent receptor [Nitrosomonadales bacterium]|nr:TonB-dependent receptor [Nitrosomonadales bacterium]
MKNFNQKQLTVSIILVFSARAHAVGVGTDVQLAPVVVTGSGYSQLANDTPSNTESRTSEELREQNLINPEDALVYMPNTTVRKRYIGDRNAILGGRDFGPGQPSRALVYVDDYLISNFLGRFDAPRWNMVTPEAIERVDVLYGPYSALFPGNSLGTTVVMKERLPKKTETSVRVTGYNEHFDQYGHSDNYGGGQLSAYIGSRTESGISLALTLNHQDATGHPMSYYGISQTAGAFPAVGAAPTQVSGIKYDTDPNGNKRAIFGISGEGSDHTVQDTVKLKMGYDFTPTLEGNALVGWWNNNTDYRVNSFLRDASGNPVWQGVVTDGVNTFNIPASAFAPSNRDQEHLQTGATLKTKFDAGWNGSVVVSEYRMLSDAARQAKNPDSSGLTDGTITHLDGTGWNTFEVQALYKPAAGDFGDGRHTLTFGVHRNAYTLKNVVNNAANWRDNSTETTLSQDYRGETLTYALYAQDAWAMTSDLKLTAGVRGERFETNNGEQTVGSGCPTVTTGLTCTNNGNGTYTVNYDNRTLSGLSPKLSLAWTARDDLLYKISYGHGVRFPNAQELYNGTSTATSVNVSDPNLKAERADDIELSTEKFWDKQSLRAALFNNDVNDAILQQSDNTVTPSVSRVSNVDKARTTGLELVWKAQDLGVRGLDVDASAAITDSKVVANSRDPRMVGMYWLRVPKQRASVLAAYRMDERWMGSLGWRYQGRSYNDVYNRDVNPNVFGGVSNVNQIDVRVAYKLKTNLDFAMGVNNLNNQHAYVYHPLSDRTLFAEMRASI